MKKLNANQKGKRFEREIAKCLNQKFDANVRRTPCSGALSIKGDIMDTTGITSKFSWECKNQEKLNIWKALHQSIGDVAGSSKIPTVVFTKNREDNFVALRFDDFLHLLKLVEESGLEI